MATEWISPTWRMPNDKNQSKFENYSLDFAGASLEHIMLGNGGHDTDLLPGKPTVAGTVNNPNFSVSAFFNFDSAILGSSRNIIGAGQTGGATYWYLRKNASDNIEFVVRNEVGSPYYITVTGSTVLNSDQWYHAAVSWNGTTITLYLDGTSEANAAATTFYFGGGPGTEWPTIGSYYRGATTQSSLWDGEIGQPCIFDYPLSQDQVNYLYNSGTPQNPMAISGQPPIAYYPLGGSSTGSASTLTVPNESVADASVFDFEGDDKIDINEVNSVFSNASNFTISGWFNWETISNANEWLFMASGTNINTKRVQIETYNQDLYFSFIGATGSLRVDMTTTQWSGWVHMVAVFDASAASADKMVIYFNGARAANVAYTEPTGNSPTDIVNVSIGNRTDGLYNFEGQISNFQIWNSSLLSSEITTLYNNGVPLYTGTQPQATNLKAWYKMNVDTSTWNGSDWLLSNSSITPTYTEGLFFGGGYIGGSPVANYAGMSLTNQTISSSNVTYSFWYKRVLPTTGSSTGIVKCIGYLGGVNVLSSGMVQWYGDAAAKYINFSGKLVADGAWHHILVYYPNAATITHADVKCYIDGSLQTNSYIGGSSSSGPVTTIRGTLIQSVPMNVELSNWAVFTTNETSNIDTIYNGGTPGDISSLNPFVWLKYDSATTAFAGATGANYGLATDSSGNSNNGNLAGRTDGTTTKLVTSNVQSGDGLSDGMNTANLVNSDLTRSIPYSSYSLNFDGGDWATPSISLNTLSASTAFSVSCWVKIDTNTNYDHLVGAPTSYAAWDTGFGLYLTGSAIRFWVEQWNGANQYVETAALNTGQWYHITATFDTTNALKLYVDGATVTTASGTTIDGLTNTIYLGSTGANATYALNGNLNNVAIWNSELTQDQILTIYNGGVPNDISSLSPSAWWSLAGDSYYDGTNFILPDLSASSNNATTANMSGIELVGNGPGSTANGVATSMDIPANLKGNAPNSSNNAFSVNMDTADRVADVPA